MQRNKHGLWRREVMLPEKGHRYPFYYSPSRYPQAAIGAELFDQLTAKKSKKKKVTLRLEAQRPMSRKAHTTSLRKGGYFMGLVKCGNCQVRGGVYRHHDKTVADKCWYCGN